MKRDLRRVKFNIVRQMHTIISNGFEGITSPINLSRTKMSIQVGPTVKPNQECFQNCNDYSWFGWQSLPVRGDSCRHPIKGQKIFLPNSRIGFHPKFIMVCVWYSFHVVRSLIPTDSVFRKPMLSPHPAYSPIQQNKIKIGQIPPSQILNTPITDCVYKGRRCVAELNRKNYQVSGANVKPYASHNMNNTKDEPAKIK